MSLKLYLDYVSQPCRAVLSLCNFGKLNIIVIEKRLMKMENYSNEMLEINPLKTFPTIVDCDNNNQRITESHTIMRYLCQTRKSLIKENFYPSNPLISCKIDEYLDWHHSNTRRCSMLLGSILPNKFFHMKNHNRNDEFKKVKQVLHTFENYFLKDGNFIGNLGNISIADLSAACEFSQLDFIDFSFKEFPKVDDWLRRIHQYNEVKEAHEVYYKILKKFREKNEQKPF